MPSPFIDMNRKVELADSETYVLVGRIEFEGAKPYFHVDLTSHPWLANAHRKEFPFYPILSARTDLHDYHGKIVQIVATAKITQSKNSKKLDFPGLFQSHDWNAKYWVELELSEEYPPQDYVPPTSAIKGPLPRS